MKKWQEDFLVIFRDFYKRKKQEDESYSIRNMAKELNIAPGPASALLKGSKIWDLSPEWAISVLNKMNIAYSEINKILVLVGKKPILNKIKISSNNHGNILTKWYYSVVLAAYDLDSRYNSPAQVAKRFQLTAEQVQEANDYLLKNNFIKKISDQRFARVDAVIETPDDFKSADIQKFHTDHLELAVKVLPTVSVEEREFQTITFAGNKETLAQIKEELRLFTEKVAILMNSQNANDEVYRFSAQIFPINLEDK